MSAEWVHVGCLLGACWVLIGRTLGAVWLLNWSHIPLSRVSMGLRLGSRPWMQRCADVQWLWDAVGNAGRRAALSGFAFCNICACAQPSTRCGAVCAALARNGVHDHDGMAWVTCAVCCRGALSGCEREARVGCQGLRCVWCVCDARASSWRRGLTRWGRVCAQRVAHVSRRVQPEAATDTNLFFL